MPVVWSFFVGKSIETVQRGCQKSDGKTDGCKEISQKLKVTGQGKRDLGGRSERDSADSAKTNTTDAPLPEGGIPDFARNISGYGGNSNKSNTKELPLDVKGTECYCNTDLCNEAGVSTLQYSGSPYFTVIGVLVLTALITLSAANDDDY